MCVDLDFCCGCYACQNACKMVNGLEDGVKWLRVMPDYCQPEEVRGELYMDRFPVPVTLKACADCPDRAKGDRPLCAKVCMGRALIVDDFEVVQKWAEGRRTVTYTL
jgi:Fe-S-cluster-containing dehydrogenase component